MQPGLGAPEPVAAAELRRLVVSGAGRGQLHCDPDRGVVGALQLAPDARACEPAHDGAAGCLLDGLRLRLSLLRRVRCRILRLSLLRRVRCRILRLRLRLRLRLFSSISISISSSSAAALPGRDENQVDARAVVVDPRGASCFPARVRLRPPWVEVPAGGSGGGRGCS